jgi:bis(5'-nucleosyl)-tetraphosphatase (symmetrical)
VAVYAIGDVQGCYDALRRLLDALAFEPGRDRLWFTGDLVNRGPRSLAVLRYVSGLDDVVTVLGNHDLHLLALASGAPSARKRSRDTLDDVLGAPDRDELLAWLSARPLAHHDDGLGWLLIHAGVPPQWDLDRTLACAREVEAVLRGDDAARFLDEMYGDEPSRWSAKLRGIARWRFITNCLTRMRYCDAHGHLDLESKGPPGTQPEGYVPWFHAPKRATRDVRIVCGHWATLGYLHEPNLLAIDTGCVWGGNLTAARLDGELRRVTISAKGP